MGLQLKSASVDIAIFALHSVGASSIIRRINFITNIINIRSNGTSIEQIPLFV